MDAFFANLGNRDEGQALGRARRTEIANGRAANLAPIIADVQEAGAASLREIAAALNERGIPTAGAVRGRLFGFSGRCYPCLPKGHA